MAEVNAFCVDAAKILHRCPAACRHPLVLRVQQRKKETQKTVGVPASQWFDRVRVFATWFVRSASEKSVRFVFVDQVDLKLVAAQRRQLKQKVERNKKYDYICTSCRCICIFRFDRRDEMHRIELFVIIIIING